MTGLGGRLDGERLLFGGAMLVILAGTVLALAGVLRDDTTLITVASSMVAAGSGSLLVAVQRDEGSDTA